MDKYIKCFSKHDANILKDKGFIFLYFQNEVWYFENNHNLTVKFSEDKILHNCKFTNTVNF